MGVNFSERWTCVVTLVGENIDAASTSGVVEVNERIDQTFSFKQMVVQSRKITIYNLFILQYISILNIALCVRYVQT